MKNKYVILTHDATKTSYFSKWTKGRNRPNYDIPMWSDNVELAAVFSKDDLEIMLSMVDTFNSRYAYKHEIVSADKARSGFKIEQKINKVIEISIDDNGDNDISGLPEGYEVKVTASAECGQIKIDAVFLANTYDSPQE